MPPAPHPQQRASQPQCHYCLLGLVPSPAAGGMGGCRFNHLIRPNTAQVRKHWRASRQRPCLNSSPLCSRPLTLCSTRIRAPQNTIPHGRQPSPARASCFCPYTCVCARTLHTDTGAAGDPLRTSQILSLLCTKSTVTQIKGPNAKDGPWPSLQERRPPCSLTSFLFSPAPRAHSPSHSDHPSVPATT